MLLVNINHFLHLIVTAQEDSTAIVNVLGNDGQHATHMAVDRLTTSCEKENQLAREFQKYTICNDVSRHTVLKDQGHRRTLVQDS